MHSADSLTLALAGIGDGLLGKGMALASCDPVRQARRLAKRRLDVAGAARPRYAADGAAAATTIPRPPHNSGPAIRWGFLFERIEELPGCAGVETVADSGAALVRGDPFSAPSPNSYEGRRRPREPRPPTC
jgi:hypothetical protein